MSAYRTIARIAAVSALNNYLEKPWPTLAGPNIFDSKIEPVEEMKSDIVFPCCVVYTDYDKDHWARSSKIHAPRLMSLTFELLIVQAKKRGRADEPFRLSTPFTDSEIEQSLDVLEGQIYWALNLGTVASDAFNYICQGYTNVTSRRGAAAEGGQRLAARQITLEMNALREPAAGTIPSEIEAFLEALEAHDDYAQRVGEIRSMLEWPKSDTPFQREMRTFGYTRAVTGTLGGVEDPTAVLPPEIVYIENGSP